MPLHHPAHPSRAVLVPSKRRGRFKIKLVFKHQGIAASAPWRATGSPIRHRRDVVLAAAAATGIAGAHRPGRVGSLFRRGRDSGEYRNPAVLREGARRRIVNSAATSRRRQHRRRCRIAFAAVRSFRAFRWVSDSSWAIPSPVAARLVAFVNAPTRLRWRLRETGIEARREGRAMVEEDSCAADRSARSPRSGMARSRCGAASIGSPRGWVRSGT